MHLHELTYDHLMAGSVEETMIDVWVGLVRAHHAVMTEIETVLKEAGFPPLGWYDVLLELDRAGEAGLRQNLLEKQLLLPQYGLSRLLARIGEAGYLEKRPCGDDRRCQTIAITPAGSQMRKAMWPVYRDSIRVHIGDVLDCEEAALLAGLLGRIAHNRGLRPKKE